MSEKNLQEYWQKNVRLLGILLVVWFVVSFADMPAKGEWLITTSKGEHVSKLTVDLERVFM